MTSGMAAVPGRGGGDMDIMTGYGRHSNGAARGFARFRSWQPFLVAGTLARSSPGRRRACTLDMVDRKDVAVRACLFEDRRVADLEPLTLTCPAFDLL